jgi:hypothetical protein
MMYAILDPDYRGPATEIRRMPQNEQHGLTLVVEACDEAEVRTLVGPIPAVVRVTEPLTDRLRRAAMTPQNQRVFTRWLY